MNLSFPHFFRPSFKENSGQISLSGTDPSNPGISLHLIYYEGLAGNNRCFIPHAAFLQQPRLVNQSGHIESQVEI
jgi:hypothetical protein